MGPELCGTSDACAESGGKSSKSSGPSDTDNSLGSEGVLGAESEDENVRNIKSWNEKGRNRARCRKMGALLEYMLL
ncbi:hypothetical protein PVK06_047629 [Gossypium arboreum]|uniref:Uncharacterized protein n=1 Tax=Gossypium arboreum TaxID=29729 RepID=A0ABR0MDU2_GOSAR|nr:hypothetical protein PVK06_047629 [Gossypium arboreum]